PLAVVTACLSVAARDFRRGRQLARSIPSKAGGTICARFAYAWGAWKLGVAGFVLMLVFVVGGLLASTTKGRDPPSGFMAAMLCWMGGFTLSAALTALGLLAVHRSGMRVWIGEGVNRAGTLLLGMLMVGFVLLVVVPVCVWITSRFPPGSDNH